MEVAGVYLRAHYRWLEESEFQDLAKKLEKLFAERSRAHFAKGSKLEVDFSESSFITKALVIGGVLFGTYNAVAMYPDFKNGAQEAYHDAISFGKEALAVFRDALGISDDQIVSKRLVPPAVDSLNKIVKDIDEIMANPNLSERDKSSTIGRVYKNLYTVCRSRLTRDEVEFVFASLPIDKIPELPTGAKEVIEWGDRRRRKAGARRPHIDEEVRAERRKLRYRATLTL